MDRNLNNSRQIKIAPEVSALFPDFTLGWLSSEALMRRVAKGKGLYSISTAVDALTLFCECEQCNTGYIQLT